MRVLEAAHAAASVALSPLGTAMDDGDPSASGGQQQHNPDAVMKNIGRDNPEILRALAKLYRKDAAKQVGNSYHSRNKTKHDQKLASGWSPPPAPSEEPPKVKVEKPKVAVPKFTKRISYGEFDHSSKFIPRRKPFEAIKREIDEEYERMHSAPPMPPKGPVLGEREKERLANLMRYRGKPPTITPEDMALLNRKAAAASRNKGEREQLEELFDAVLQEIEERRSFLRDLESHGALKRDTVHMLRAEIQQRVAELERIDLLMKKADGIGKE